METEIRENFYGRMIDAGAYSPSAFWQNIFAKKAFALREGGIGMK